MSKKTDKSGFEEKEKDIPVKKEKKTEENNVDSKTTRAKWIPMRMIDPNDHTYHVRKENDQETIERYTAVWKDAIGDRPIGRGTKSPFPEILVTERDDGIFIPVAGWHRLLAAIFALLGMIYAKVISGTHDELLKLAMQSNGNNGLPMGEGDLRHCIEKVQRSHPEWNSLKVAEFIKICSPSYVAQIEREQRESGAIKVPERRLGKDGKMYSTAKKTNKGQGRKSKSAKKVSKTKKAAKKTIPPSQGDRPEAKEQNAGCNMSMLFDGWKNDPSTLSDTLDSFEQHLVSNDEKSNLYKIIKKWLGRRKTAPSNRSIAQNKTEGQK